VKDHQSSAVHKGAVATATDVVEMHQEYTQVRNLRERVTSAARLSNDGLANIHELVYDLPNFVWLIQTFPDLILLAGREKILQELNHLLQQHSRTIRSFYSMTPRLTLDSSTCRCCCLALRFAEKPVIPAHVNGNHLALLIADVQALTVGVAGSLPTLSSLEYIVHFKRYMAARAKMTDELATWTDMEYTIPQKNDDISCGVLALMAAEAATQGQPLSTIDPGAVVLPALH